MISLISTPAYVDPADPTVICRWLATECPNNFRLLRHDFNIVTAVNNAGYLRLTVAAGTFTGQIGDTISIYNKSLDAVYVGTVTAGSGTTTINTDIAFIAGFDPTDAALDPDRLITYINDNTLRASYYFEGRMTINGVVNTLTIIASPDSYGYADLDVSGLLRITTSLGKTGDYTQKVMKEPTKSGNFTLEYRESWFGSAKAYTAEGNYWWYAESVRSEEQGSNLHNFVADALNDAPFFNQFEEPVYFWGLPFDLSFILPELYQVSPSLDLTVNFEFFDSNNTSLGTYTEVINSWSLDGFVCSLNIDQATIPANAAYFTAEITSP